MPSNLEPKLPPIVVLDNVNDLKNQEPGNESHRQDRKDDLVSVGHLGGLVHRDLPPGVPDRLPVLPPPALQLRLGHQLVFAIPRVHASMRVHANLKGTMVAHTTEKPAIL